MPSTPIRTDAYGYLRDSRVAVLACFNGLDERRLRLPMTRSGTNLLGIVKHLIGIEAGYLGVCLGPPFPRPLPWIEDESAGPNRDVWAAVDESSAYVVDLYRRACDHSDSVLHDVGLEAQAAVPWWPEGDRETTANGLVARVLKDTSMHAGQLQILRELIDGRAGSDFSDAGDPAWWTDYVERLRKVAEAFPAEPAAR